MKHTGLALHNAHYFSSLAITAEKKGWAKRGRLFEFLIATICNVAGVIYFQWQRESCPTFPVGFARVCVCVWVYLREMEGGDKARETGLDSCMADCHPSAPGRTLPFSRRTQCAAGIKMLCKVRTLAPMENSFTAFCSSVLKNFIKFTS